MSQEKVDRYKEQKSKRKEQIAKEKKKRVLTHNILIAVAVVVVVVVIGAVGLTIRNEVKSYRDSLPSYSTTSFLVTDEAGVRSAEDAD